MSRTLLNGQTDSDIDGGRNAGIEHRKGQEMASIWDGFRGHFDQIEMFRRTVERGRLTQAYLLVGPEGIGKQLFARRLAECLLCQNRPRNQLEACGECPGCRPFLAGAHPDYLFVDREPGKRELTVGKIVGDDDQQGLCHDLALRPLPGSRKVAVVNDADTMNDVTANALLKTLEEPPDGAVLFLIASNLDSVLPTIRSRCQLVRFSPLSTDDIAGLLELQGVTATRDEAAAIAALSEGSLATARQLLDPGLRGLQLLLLDELSRLDFSGLGLAKRLQEGLDKLSSEAAEQRVFAHWLIRFTVEFYRAVLWEIGGASADAGAATKAACAWIDALPLTAEEATDLVGQLIERAAQATGHIEQNVSVSLALEGLFDELARLTRAALPSRQALAR